MTDAPILLEEARRLGFEVTRNGDRLHVEGPQDAEWFVAKLAEAKLDILAELNRPHCIVLRTYPYDDETHTHDIDDGRRIVADIEARGGKLDITRHGIALTWTGEMIDLGELIDRIRANRIGVVKALTDRTAGA